MDFVTEIFAKYSWSGLIGLILITSVFLCGKWINNKLSNDVSSGLEKVGEKLTNQITQQNAQLVNVFVSQQDKLLDTILHKDKQAVVKHNEMLIDKIKLAAEINQSLKEIMISHHAQRAFVIEFHNSSNNLSGVPFAKYSCTYEYFDRGLFPLSTKCNGLPFSQMAKITFEVIRESNQIKIYDDIQKLADENPQLWGALGEENSPTKLVIYAAMYDKNNILIGMLCLEYRKEHNITEAEINELSVETAQITSIINLRYKYSD